MPGNNHPEKDQETAPSRIDHDIVRHQILSFLQLACSSTDGTVPWSVKPIRKSLDLSSDSIEPKTDLVKQNSDDEKVSVSSETSSFKRSSNTSESSVYDTDSDSSTFDSDKVSCSSSLRFRPVKMSPPVESSLLKRKLNRHRDSCHSSLDSDVDNLPFKKPNKNIIGEKKLESDFDDDSLLFSPRSHKVGRISVRNLENEFSSKLLSTLSPVRKEIDKIDSSEMNEKYSNDSAFVIGSSSDTDDKSIVPLDPEEDSDEVFRPTRKMTVQKRSESPALLTPPLTEVRVTRSSRLSARKLFPSLVAEKPEPQSPRTPKSSKPRKVNGTPKVNVKLLTPSRGRVDSPLRTPTTPRDKAKHALALSAAPESLPCRGKEFQTVYDFVRQKISSKESGVLCINGVPGSGKTATIRRVLKKLTVETEQKKLNKFKAIEVNAFDLRRSKEIYRKIYELLTGERKTINIAEQLLTERFMLQKRNANRIPVVLIIDEFDCLLAKKRDVIYKIVEWQAYDNSQLVLLTIANKLDFSDEKKLFSRIKFEKLAFVAYSFQELEVIIKDRLKEFNGFKPEAIQYIARKVAATSGDARKALDICRQVLDTVEAEDENFVFTIDYVMKMLEKIFSNPNVRIIRQLTDLEKIALRALRDELLRTDKAFCTLWNGVWNQFEAICNMDGFTRINCNSLLQNYAYLASIGLVKIETDHLDQHSKIWLKCDTDVIKVALK